MKNCAMKYNPKLYEMTASLYLSFISEGCQISIRKLNQQVRQD